MVSFNGKILIIGCGAVAQCALELLLKHKTFKPDTLVVIDKLDKREVVSKLFNDRFSFFQEEISKDNFKFILARYLTGGDICIDLANEVDTHDILTWCLNNGVMYLNSSLNVWPQMHTSLYEMYRATKKLIASWPKNSPTAILTHGANPGLISSFTKKALSDCALDLLQSPIGDPSSHPLIEKALLDRHYARIAQALNIKTIHISESDSQKTAKEKQKNEFLNTWSVVEFINECKASVEFPWGTHETYVPPDSSLVNHSLFINSRACNFKLKSWVPSQPIEGFVIPHDETYTLGDYLTIKQDDKVRYKPTVLFVYKPSPNAILSLKELELNNFIPQPIQRVMKENLISGADIMGCLLMGYNNNTAWWTGSYLTLEQTKNIVAHQNATVMQVAAGVLAALIEMIKNPQKGICFPEELDHEMIIQHALAYLGTFISAPTAWKPVPHTTWEFKDFLPVTGDNPSQ